MKEGDKQQINEVENEYLHEKFENKQFGTNLSNENCWMQISLSFDYLIYFENDQCTI